MEDPDMTAEVYETNARKILMCNTMGIGHASPLANQLAATEHQPLLTLGLEGRYFGDETREVLQTCCAPYRLFAALHGQLDAMVATLPPELVEEWTRLRVKTARRAGPALEEMRARLAGGGDSA